MSITTPPATEQLERLPLPAPRGELSQAVLTLLRDGRAGCPDPLDADPYGDDLQLALAVVHELHYRGVDGVPDDREWDPEVIRVRLALEDHFLAALRSELPAGDDVDGATEELLVEPAQGTGITHHLMREGTREQFAEYLTHLAHYHRKEADPQSWVIPRLQGPAKAGLVTVEHDEYGAGRHTQMHSTLFARMMAELGLDTAYGAHLSVTNRWMLATVNLQTMSGLRRALRGISVGMFAVIELTSSPGSARLVSAAQRLGLGPATERFYAEHVEADAVHEQLLRRDVLRPLLALEPSLTADVVLGMQASTFLGNRLAEDVLAAWRAGRSSLTAPTG